MFDARFSGEDSSEPEELNSDASRFERERSSNTIF